MRRSITVKALLLIAAFVAIPAFSPGQVNNAALSEWVYFGADGKLKYKTTPGGDKIMDFSHAGYMGGGVALPDVSVIKRVKPSGSADDTESIQAAINEVAALPLTNGFRGTVLLEPGVFKCSGEIAITADGIVLRGSGTGENGTTIRMSGPRHTAVNIRKERNSQTATGSQAAAMVESVIADSYVPSGALSFSVADSKGFLVGDLIEIRKPVTREWIHFMEMDNLVRDGKPQTWIREGTTINTRRMISSIAGNKITLSVPLSDSFDSKFAQPEGTRVVKIQAPALVSRCGLENVHIVSPPMEMSYESMPYTAFRINGEDCWAKNVLVEETMNSVGVGGNRITLEDIVVTRSVPNVGASKPAEFAPNAGQILMNRCSSHGDNIWHVATGGGQAGPIVLLNCKFTGNGHIEGHQRWTTGILVDNCQANDGGIDFKNRGSMGSGHGWGSAWSVAWNCSAKSYVVQLPPGTCNWMIGCIGPNLPTPRPFDKSPALPLGISDSPGVHVTPASLYLTQLEERLGKQALKNIGY